MSLTPRKPIVPTTAHVQQSMLLWTILDGCKSPAGREYVVAVRVRQETKLVQMIEDSEVRKGSKSNFNGRERDDKDQGIEYSIRRQAFDRDECS